MATLVTEQGVVHYESYGRGRPVLLLHGWLGSWMLWRNTIETLGQHYRTYALDFFGFGESGDKADSFSVDNFVLLVSQFMDRLGIVEAPIVGHSMGGTVALSTAVIFPERVSKVVVIGSPIQGSSLNLLLKMSGNPNFANLIWRFPGLLKLFLSYYATFMANDGQQMSRMIQSDISKVTVHSFFESIRTLRQKDITLDIHSLKMPIMGMYGRKDIIVHPNQARVLQQHVSHSVVDWYEDAGHFIMLDAPDRFHASIREFIDYT